VHEVCLWRPGGYKSSVMNPPTARRRLLACLLPAVLALLAPARADAACPAQPLAQRFVHWGDLAWYAALPDSGFEAGGAWTLGGGAAAVAGNEPYFIGTPQDTRSLSLPAGASATSAPFCLGLGHPALRLVLRNQGAADSRLAVSALFTDAAGVRRTLALGALTAGSAWNAGPPVAVIVNLLSPLDTQSVAFRFAPADARGRWSIDDVFVDPYGKG
jgi:hypothetical protein